MGAALQELRNDYQTARAELCRLARIDPIAFVSYVMRDEHTGAPIDVQPFQSEWFRMADEHDRLLILAFMESGKSFCLSIAMTLFELGRDPTLQFAIVSRTSRQAKKIALAIAQYLESSPELHEVFPHMRPDPRMPWNSEQLSVVRPPGVISKDPSVQVVSLGSSVQGARLDRVVLDDVLDRINTKTPSQRDDTWMWYQKSIPGRMMATGKIIAVGNAFHREDLYHRLALNERWQAYRFPVLKPDGSSAWPAQWPMDRIRARRIELGELEFKCQMLCLPVNFLVSGQMFQRAEVLIVDSYDGKIVKWVRRWDLAATEPHEGNWDPDWTCGVKMGRTKDGKYVVGHVHFARVRAARVRKLIVTTAQTDGHEVAIGIPQDPGQAGVEQAQSYVKELSGFTVWTDRETGDKVTRAEPYSSQWQNGNVILLRGAWNQQYLDLMEAFPTPGVHDDPVDASSGAFVKIAASVSIFDHL